MKALTAIGLTLKTLALAAWHWRRWLSARLDGNHARAAQELLRLGWKLRDIERRMTTL